MSSEKRLIDAMHLVTKISRRVRGMSIPQDIYDGVLECIADAPTIDAVPVVHGRWDKRKDDELVGYDTRGNIQCRNVHSYYCTKCGQNASVKSNYCPNCGAKMDGDGDG